MPTLIDRLRRPRTEARHMVSLFDTWSVGSGTGDEKLRHNYQVYAAEGYMGNGPVFSLINRRVLSFSEVKVAWRTPAGDLLDGGDLDILRNPWPNGTLADLLAWMELDNQLGGNAYILRDPQAGTLKRLRPDWVEIVPDDNPSLVAGYRYTEGGPASGEKPRFYLADEVAHYAPVKDPLAKFRGMSWLTPVAREVDADTQMTLHKLKFFENAATPNMVVKFERKFATPEEREVARAEFNRRYQGGDNAYKTMLLEGGVDVEMVGSTMRNAAVVELQADGENRLAEAAGVPPIVVGFTKGLDAATYSNYGQARRAFVDLTLRPLWQFACGALDTIVTAPRRSPAGTHLWYDPSGISLLQADEADEANIKATDAGTINALITAGFTAESVVEAVTSGDFTRLEHTDLFSVQLQPPGTVDPEPEPMPGGDMDDMEDPSDD